MIDEFRGQYYFLSNYYKSKITISGNTYQNAEAAYQATCCANVSDRLQFRTMDGSEARAAGKNTWKRHEYEYMKDRIMYMVVKEKFKQNGYLRKRLLETGDEQIEFCNTWRDTYWGVCGGYGKNILGKILMQVRDELRVGNWDSSIW